MAEAAQRQQRPDTLATLYEGKLRLERRNGGAKIYARTFIQGKNIVKSTGSFNGALIFVVITALLAIVAYLPLVGEIKRVDLKLPEPAGGAA